MEGKVKKAVGIALLVCVALTGLGLAAQPAAAAETTQIVASPITVVLCEGGHDDPVTQTCHYYCDDPLDKFDPPVSKSVSQNQT